MGGCLTRTLLTNRLTLEEVNKAIDALSEGEAKDWAMTKGIKALYEQLLATMEREAMLRAALADAVHFLRNRHNMGRGTREERRLSVLANAEEALNQHEVSDAPTSKSSTRGIK